jgi:hypothetical protein
VSLHLLFLLRVLSTVMLLYLFHEWGTLRLIEGYITNEQKSEPCSLYAKPRVFLPTPHRPLKVASY